MAGEVLDWSCNQVLCEWKIFATSVGSWIVDTSDLNQTKKTTDLNVMSNILTFEDAGLFQ